jgi:lipooligosaccharide transport system permease protein
VLRGHLGWIAFRLVTVCTIYLAIMEAFDTLRSGLAVLAIPAGVLSGLAFVAPIMAFAGAQQNDRGFSALYRFGLIPLFLFSGTFFPITQLPRWLQFVAWVTPLYHGVALCRGLALGDLGVGPALVHTAYLAVVVGVGYWLATRSYAKRLVI